MIATACTSLNSGRRASAGFNLIELAIAALVMALLIGGLIVPLQTQMEGRRIDETRRILDQAREALLGYVAANGYFPCPADYAGGSNGQEAIGSVHTAGAGACPASVIGGGATGVYIGYLPAASLGFTPVDAQGYALDAWGFQTISRLRYAVSSQNVGPAIIPFVRANGMRTAGMSAIQNTALFSVCSTQTGSSPTGCPAATTLTSNAIAVIWSLGSNAGSLATATADELENAETLGTADRVFVQQVTSNVPGAVFDDQLTWIGPSLLFSRMIAAGMLP